MEVQEQASHVAERVHEHGVTTVIQTRGEPPKKDAAMPMEPAPAAISTKSEQKVKGRGVAKAREQSTKSKTEVEQESTRSPKVATERQWSVLSICMCGCLFRHVRICSKCEARSSDAVRRSWLSLV